MCEFDKKENLTLNFIIMRKITILMSLLLVSMMSYGQTLIWEEDFEAATIPSGWGTFNDGTSSGVQDWTFGSGEMPDGADFDNNAAIFDDDDAGDSGLHDRRWLRMTEGIDGSLYSDITIGYEYALQEFGDIGNLFVSIYASQTDAGWYIFQIYDDDQDPLYVEYDLEPFLASHADAIDRSDIRIAFTFDDQTSEWGYGAGIGSVNLKGIPVIPENDACDNSTDMTESITDTGAYSGEQNAIFATNNEGCLSTCGSGSYEDGGMNDGVWYSFFAYHDGEYTVTVNPDAWDCEVGVYTGYCDDLDCYDSYDSELTGHAETGYIDAIAGTQYFINIGHWGSSSNANEGAFSIDISFDCGGDAPSNDLIANGIQIYSSTYTETEINFPCAANEGGFIDDSGCNLNIGPLHTVYYKFETTASSVVIASISENTYYENTAVIFYEAPSLDATEADLVLLPQESNPCFYGTTSTITTTAGSFYYLAVMGSSISDVTIEGVQSYEVPENDACDNAIDFTEDFLSGYYSIEQDATHATNNDGWIATDCGSEDAGMNDGVWYGFDNLYSGEVSIEVAPDDSWAPSIGVYTGECGALVCVATVETGSYGDVAFLTFNAILGETYIINIGDGSPFGSIPPEDGPEGPFVMTVTKVCSDVPVNGLIGDAKIVTPVTYTDADVNFPCADLQEVGLGTPCELTGLRTSYYKFESIDESEVIITFSDNNDMSGAMFYEAPSLDATEAELDYIDIATNDCAPGLEHSITTEEGKFYYIVAINGNQSDIYINGTNHTTGIATSKIDGFEMYPNPVTSILTLNAVYSIDVVKIYNLIGQEVLSVSPSAAETQIDMSALPTGAYVLKVKAGEQFGTYNLIKE